jgi:lipid-binding SYLF domain-containing protein
MRKFLLVGFIAGLTLALTASPAGAGDAEDATKLVADSGTSLDHFTSDPDMSWFRSNAKSAKGLFICSEVANAGFNIGGSGGRCVLVAKGDKGWNGPAFYTIGTASVGFQAGIQVAEIVMLVKTQKALDSLMSKDFKLGGEASVAAGPVGIGTGATIKADFVAYTRSKGVYGGVNLSGARIKPTEDFNNAYYGKDVTPIGIIARGDVHNPSADDFMSKVGKLWGGK